MYLSVFLSKVMRWVMKLWWFASKKAPTADIFSGEWKVKGFYGNRVYRTAFTPRCFVHPLWLFKGEPSTPSPQDQVLAHGSISRIFWWAHGGILISPSLYGPHLTVVWGSASSIVGIMTGHSAGKSLSLAFLLGMLLTSVKSQICNDTIENEVSNINVLYVYIFYLLLAETDILSSIWTRVEPFCQLSSCSSMETNIDDDVIKWKNFPRYWPFVLGIYRPSMNSPHEGQWRGALMFSMICTSMNGWVNNREAGGLRRHRAHYAVTVMW